MFRRILLWFGGMLVVSFVGYVATSYWLSQRAPFREDLRRRLADFQLSEAVRAYKSGGSPALAEFMKSLDEHFPPNHYLVDRQGRDLITGEDRSELMNERGPRVRRRPGPRFRFGGPERFVVKRFSPDGQYVLLIEIELRPDPFGNLAVYAWIVVVIVLLCYVLAWTLAKPVGELREAVIQFGRGNLASRMNSTRRDELGDLAREFDRMADRIQTLLTAERRLLQDVSHELRSPLARLRFAAELAKSSPDPEAAFARVNKEIDRLATLVGELLQVTRAEGDSEARNVSAIDLNAFLESIVEDCRIEAEAKGCKIDLHAAGSFVWHGDRELVHRAIENVIRNAIHHAPAGTAIEVNLLTEDDQIIFRIRDYGPGVPPDQLSQIFRPFYRVEEDRNRNNGGGVGLGLAIVERAVRLHHGEVRAQNMDPGLLIEVRLPK
jgi:two-component system sensor histidine kinase CpxA